MTNRHARVLGVVMMVTMGCQPNVAPADKAGAGAGVTGESHEAPPTGGNASTPRPATGSVKLTLRAK